jgi:hypothetical protein
MPRLAASRAAARVWNGSVSAMRRASLAKPWRFSVRNTGSLVERAREQPQRRRASSTLATAWLVSRRQWAGVAGGAISGTSIRVSGTLCASRLAASPVRLAGRRRVTRRRRSASVAVRPGRPAG